MFLYKLDIQGFKSFCDKTELLFGDGITGVIGPNGCGKTNVSDAIRWVLGEQSAKQLRGDSMEDVIFNGCPSRKPLGMAEVHLTFKNDRGILPTEFSEVTVSRRVFRSGMSEYFLNKTPCRLKDIKDLFFDTGMGSHAYSVIERSMVDNILSDNTNHRRFLFEEASGITKYKARKKEALNKLEALHSVVFHEIHVNNNLLVDRDPEKTEKLHRAFLKANGVPEAEFDRTYRSFSVESKLQRAEQLTHRYRVTGVPMMVVNGKYTADVGSAGSEPQLVTLVNDLAAAEHKH